MVKNIFIFFHNAFLYKLVKIFFFPGKRFESETVLKDDKVKIIFQC